MAESSASSSSTRWSGGAAADVLGAPDAERRGRPRALDARGRADAADARVLLIAISRHFRRSRDRGALPTSESLPTVAAERTAGLERILLYLPPGVKT